MAVLEVSGEQANEMDGGILRGILLIIAMLALGGIIAFVGDRVGSKAGKARLRLGKLRPRQTASLVTIATGTLTAAVVTGILLATSESLRQGLFRIREINRELAQTRKARDRAMVELESIRADLEAAETSKTRIQQELDEAETAKAEAQQDLDRLDSQLQDERAQAQQLRADIDELQSEIGTLTAGRQDLVTERERLQGEIETRDRELAAREEEINLQEGELQASAARLNRLETQRQDLAVRLRELQDEIGDREDQIATLGIARRTLEVEVRALEGDLARSESLVRNQQLTPAAIERGEAIVSVGVRVGLDLSAQEAVDRVLSAANKLAFRKLFPRNNGADERQILFISEEAVAQLRADISDGERHIIRVRSAKNYFQGLQDEERIDIVIERISDAEVFQLGDTVAAVRVTEDRVQSRAQLERHIEELTERLRARSGSLIDRAIFYGDENFTFLNFFERLQQLETPIDSIEAVAREQIFLSGPLKVDLVARYEGRVVLSSDDPLALEDEEPTDESALSQ